MKFTLIFFIIGSVLTYLNWKKIYIINIQWIILCFVLVIVSFYISMHLKNKERNTPKPVYLTN